MSAQPILQIIHISDLHIRKSSFVKPNWVDAGAKLPAIGEVIEEGTADHAPRALKEFRHFLPLVAHDDLASAGDGQWRDVDTWLVDTGDLTTYGDSASLRVGFDWLDDCRQELEVALNGTVQVFSTHGNHDAWPETLPLLNPSRIPTHRAQLRRSYDSWAPPDGTPWPKDPLATSKHPVGHAQPRVFLFGLNTVLHDAVYNTLALGLVEEDRWWENGRKCSRPGVQLAQLANRVGNCGLPSLRVVAMHHPVRYPNRTNGTLTKRLINEQEVDQVLSSGSIRHQPAVNLILAGHTHEFHPPLGKLPVTSPPHIPLQLIVGPLSQNDVLKRRGQYAHQAQLIRLLWDPAEPTAMILRRTLLSRNGSQGPFRRVLVRNCGYEELRIEI